MYINIHIFGYINVKDAGSASFAGNSSLIALLRNGKKMLK
jgi:hypothetical protein